MRNKMKLKLTLLSKSAAVFGLLASLTACSASKWHETQGTPNTGDQIAERQVVTPSPLRIGDRGFVSSDRLSAPAKNQSKKTAPALERNDEIEITDPHPENAEGQFEGLVITSKVPNVKGTKRFFPKAYVSQKPVVPTNEENARDKYFVIQNIATEKLRVYRTCFSKSASGDCVHKMVFETDMAAGKDTNRGRSLLGSYRISEWFKFYEDEDHFYPSFAAENYPDLPKVGEALSAWLSKSRLPKGKGLIRGAFGWYTAKISPNADDQWTHGTLGWGVDGGKFLDAAKDPSNAAVFTRSLGCTRIENQAIALMREILPVGTRMFKVYAKEGYAEAARATYKADAKVQWAWVLTQDGTLSTTAKSGAKHNLVPKEADVLDRGTYSLNQIPEAVPFLAGISSKNEQNGNLYNIAESSLKGVLLVDEGRLAGYEHPAELTVGGFEDHKLPSLVVSAGVRAKPVKAASLPTLKNASFN